MMSHELISRSPDLRQLQDEGYQVEVYNAYLLIHNVPYVNSNKQVAYGTLVSDLDLAGNVTRKPSTHVAKWVGEYPRDSKGAPLEKLVNDPNLRETIREGLVTTCSFSHKPPEGYPDYHKKMTRYIQILEGQARALDQSVAARKYPVVPAKEEESVFCYADNASSRVGIVAINEKLKNDRIAIVGLGGTGAYILDLVAKTSVAEIHLFDGDSLMQHNAFRSPGAPSIEDLAKEPKKVYWFAEIYSRMRKNIHAHPKFIDETNVADLKKVADFVFICLDRGAPRQKIVDYLIDNKIPFIDVGIGLYTENGSLWGSLRVTTCTPTFHHQSRQRIHYTDGPENEYSRNIQIAEMNALNAALAVIKWKKLRGFYLDFEHEHNTIYGTNTNVITNGDIQDEEKTVPAQVC